MLAQAELENLPGFPPFPPDYRASGLLLPITALPSPYGIGDMGASAFAWIDRLREAGQSWWQALPLGPTGYGNSPYQSFSSFAANGLLISPDVVIADGLLHRDACSHASFPPGSVDYASVIRFKHGLLDQAWIKFRSGARKDLIPAYDQFCHHEAHWLEDYALFRALKEKHHGAPYWDWPSQLVHRAPTELDRARRELSEQVGRVRFAQFMIFQQALRLKEHAHARGIHLIGDVPFFVSRDSSDLWAHPELFLLDSHCRPRFIAGVPPDLFSADGQLWGNPVYDWEALRRTGFRFHIDRLQALLVHVDVIRLDHFRGFAAAWHVPAGALTARTGEWVPGPGPDFFHAIHRELGALPFIAEDLGVITPDVVALRDSFHLPGTRVLQFAFEGNEDNPHLPSNHPRNSVVYTGTHDNNTTRGWFEALSPRERKTVWRYLKRADGEAAELAPELLRLAWSSPAALAIVPLQDLLNLGAEARMNLPGSLGANWCWRATERMLQAPAFLQLRDLTGCEGRLPAPRGAAVADATGAVQLPRVQHSPNGRKGGDRMSPAQLLEELGPVINRENERGRSSPLGATVDARGVNFSVYSRDASRVDLLLFDREDDARPARAISLDPVTNRSYHYWHIFVPGAQAGQLYGYRVHGPFDPSRGLRFDPSKLLLDPYGRGVVMPKTYSREAAQRQGDNAATAMKSVVVNPSLYDWEDDGPLHLSSSRSIVYEMHVKGFTRHPTSGVGEETRGTFRGLIEKIPYLRDLGITAVELLPVFQFDPQDCPPNRGNYWGYAPVAFFAPHQAYSSRRDPAGPVDEFRDMVKALHRAGIEVILDVVFNHTAEGNHDGPTQCFRGFDNCAYYVLEPDRTYYSNYSGTGNTLNANHPIVRRMIVDSLRYWVKEMHVDGFRFDLASILARDSRGHVMASPPVLWDIESDPALAGTKMIAEAWDAAGLYQVGSFVGDSWKEWNGRFRDDVRSFFRGEENMVPRFADRILGSHEVYGHKQREAEQSVNFVTCHDGFTLNDLVSYNRKHNEANGENNRDGGDDNRSWNCGVEGPTDDPEIERLRNRQVKNFYATTMLSLGLPMLLMGDEVRRTQRGNNNAYSEDNEANWFDWSLLQKHADVHRFVKLLAARRLLRGTGPESKRMSLTELLGKAVHAWHGVKLNQPDWSNHSHSLAFSAEMQEYPLSAFLIFNAYWEPLEFELPRIEGVQEASWRRWIDTTLEPPQDIVEWQSAPKLAGGSYRAGPRSVVVLWASRDGEGVTGSLATAAVAATSPTMPQRTSPPTGPPMPW